MTDLLVAGGDRVDAGKTTFAAGLLAHLRAAGADPAGFKPRAGNDYWFDHDDVLAAAAGGRLYGKDARRLASATADPAAGTDAPTPGGAGPSAGGTDPTADDGPGSRSDGAGGRRADVAGEGPAPEAINPVHRLWRPTPGRTGPLGEPGRTALVDRVRTAEGDRFVVNATAELPAPVWERLPLSGAVRVDSLEAFDAAMADLHAPALERFGRVVERRETAVVESYGDIALPLRGFRPDAVAVVVPGRVRVYDGDRYVRAREVAGGSPHEGRLEERVGNVEELADPEGSVPLPALAAEEREDPGSVAAAYAEAYLALLDAA